MMSAKRSILCILTAGVLWSSLGIFVRSLNEAGIMSMDIVFLRAVVTAAALFVYLLIRNRDLLRIRLRDVWCFLGTGIASITFFNYCYFQTVAMASLSTAAVLLYTAPVFVMVLSYFLFKEEFSGKKVAAIVLTVAGCALVTGVLEGGQAVTWQAVLYGLGAGLGYGLYSIFGRFALEKGYHSLTITFYTFAVAAVSTVFFADIRGIAAVSFSSASMLFVSVALGIVCTVLPFLLYTVGLLGTDNSTASIVASIEPVTATLFGVIVYRESIDTAQICGIVLVLAGVVTANRKGRGKNGK